MAECIEMRLAQTADAGAIRDLTRDAYGNIALYSRLGYHVDREEEIEGGLVRTNTSKRLTANPHR